MTNEDQDQQQVVEDVTVESVETSTDPGSPNSPVQEDAIGTPKGTTPPEVSTDSVTAAPPLPIQTGFVIEDATGIKFKLNVQEDVTPYEVHLINMIFISLLALNQPSWDVAGYVFGNKIHRHFLVSHEAHKEPQTL